MMLYRKLTMAVCPLLFAAAVATAQTPAATATAPASKPAANATATAATQEGGTPTYIRPETPEQRKARLGTAEDPGPNPDPDKHFWRFGKSQHIERYERRWAVSEGGEPGFIRPFGFVNLYRELYQQNDRYVWVWADDAAPEPPPAADTTPANSTRFQEDDIAFFSKIRSEFSEFTPATNDKVIKFTDSSEGLPTSGSWRNSLAVGDMNNDGFVDIIAPPERAGGNTPRIFLGDGKGHWTLWQNVKWPHGFDYGSAAVGDFNKDGNLDIALSVHLNGVYAMLGDGKGNFTEVTEGLARDFPTRRVVVTDVDHDGYADIVAISEGPTALQRADDPNASRIRAFLSRKKDGKTVFEPVNVSDPTRRFGGDWLAYGDLNGDGFPDFIGASVFFNSTDNGWLSDGAKSWKEMTNTSDNIVFPYVSYYYASVMGHFTSKKTDDALVSYVRYWPPDLPAKVVPEPATKNVVGIDRLVYQNGLFKRSPVVRWSSARGVWGLATGDFDGDGNLDIVYTRFEPREAVILLGDGKGGFTRAKIDGLKLEQNTNYDLKVADVNGDGRPDIILMYESSGKTAFAVRDGSIKVWLNQGVTKSVAPAATTK